MVTLPGNEGAFSGVLMDYDDTFWRFENCHSVPRHPGETSDEWPGRIWIKHNTSPSPYLQEITPWAMEQLKINV